jgi:predicted Zn-dependent protease
MRRPLLCAAVLGALLIVTGCQTLDTITNLGTSVGVATGALSQDQAESINRTSSAVGKTFDTITPEQEYWIGRTVAATLLSQTKPFDGSAANDYLNTLGQYLALCSERPETFGGYRFQIIDSEEINAFATPGGFILISRGMLRCCKTEEAVAAVLAHEIGHVELKHGLKSIDKSRMTGAVTTVLTEAGKNLGGRELGEVTKAFEGSISDITSTMVNSGYSRQFESQADKAAVGVLRNAGYDPNGLVTMLSEMEMRLKPGGRDFAKTHPDPKVRIREVRALVGDVPATQPSGARQKRFEKAMRGV